MALPSALNAGELSPLIEKLAESNSSLHRETLDNGMVCLVKADRSAPVVAVQIWVGTGAIHEGEHLGAGLSHYMEHMIFKGTPTRGPADITRQIDEAGGEINAYTAHDRTVFHADLPSRNWKVGVDVLSDAVMNASLPEDEWQREKDVILREFAMGKDSPGRVHGKLLYDTAYRVHPYRVPVIGYEDVFNTMNRDTLEAFFREHYTPDNMIFSIVGDIDAGEVMAYLKETFKDFKRRARKPVVLPEEPPQMSPRIARETGAYNVSRLHWVYHTVPIGHPDVAALDVLASVLGDGRSSILNRRLQEEKRLVQSIDAWSHTPGSAGLFGISATYEPDREDEVLAAIREELRDCLKNGFTAEQIAKARRNQVVGALSALQTMSGQCSGYAAGEYYTGDPRFTEHYLAELDKIDNADLLDVLQRYIINGNESIAILSPARSGEVTTGPASAGELTVETARLSNGIPLLVRHDTRLPFVYISVVMRGGLLSETEENNGITQLMAELLTRGTAKRTAAEIAEDIESRGASLGAFSGRNTFGLNAHGLSGDADMLVATVAECLTKPSFPEEEIDKQKKIQLSAILQQREQPMFLVQQTLRQMLYPDHPYRLDMAGREASIASITREQISSFFGDHFAADNMVISIFGDITLDEAKTLADRYFGTLTGTAKYRDSWEAPAPVLPASENMTGPFEQAILLMGYPGVTMTDPRADALNVLQRALSGLSSDLAIEIRDKRGLVYYVGAFSMTGIEPGVFAFYAGTTTAQMPEVEELIREQVKRIAGEGIRQDEFDRARAQIIAGTDMSIQNTGELAQICALNELYGLGHGYIFATADRLNALSQDDIKEAAAGLLKDEHLAIATIGPEEPTANP